MNLLVNQQSKKDDIPQILASGESPDWYFILIRYSQDALRFFESLRTTESS